MTITRLIQLAAALLLAGTVHANNGTVTVVNHLNRAIYVSCPNAARTPDIPADSPLTVYMGARLNSIYSALNMQHSGDCTYHFDSRQGPVIGRAHFELYGANSSAGLLPNYDSAAVTVTTTNAHIRVTPESGSGRNITFTIYPAQG